MKTAIIGVTGLVGNTMLKVLEEQNFPVNELIPVASQKSAGRKVDFKNQEYEVIDIDAALKKKPDIALFSAGSEISLQYAPKFAEQACFVIDNSSAWRQNPEIPLIVPEINANILTFENKIIANPNCSTIQMVLALAPLHSKYKIKRLVISTYQSVSGTGYEALKQLADERRNIPPRRVYPYAIDLNCLPHCDDFLENGYTKEEMKLVTETNKILNADIKITATAVRVPVAGGHSEAVNIEFENEFDIKQIREILEQTEGIIVQDDIENNIYPMPLYSESRDEVFVGRLRRDFSKDKCLNMWITVDNLRKGAATNAVQIAKYIIDNFDKKY